MEDRAINGDPRITLLHAYADQWNLQIDGIDEDDAGIYRCVINTGAYKTITLDVKGKIDRTGRRTTRKPTRCSSTEDH